MREMGDNLRNHPITFVSGSQPATGSKQLEAARDPKHSHISTHLISAFYTSDTNQLHDFLQHFETYLNLRTT